MLIYVIAMMVVIMKLNKEILRESINKTNKILKIVI